MPLTAATIKRFHRSAFNHRRSFVKCPRPIALGMFTKGRSESSVIIGLEGKTNQAALSIRVPASACSAKNKLAEICREVLCATKMPKFAGFCPSTYLSICTPRIYIAASRRLLRPARPNPSRNRCVITLTALGSPPRMPALSRAGGRILNF